MKKIITNHKKQHMNFSSKEQISSESPDQIEQIMKISQLKEAISYITTNKQAPLLCVVDAFARI